jgi:hypothetical protein
VIGYLVTGHNSGIHAVAMSRMKCASNPQISPDSTSSAFAQRVEREVTL